MEEKKENKIESIEDMVSSKDTNSIEKYNKQKDLLKDVMKLSHPMTLNKVLNSTIGLNASLAQSNSLAMTAMKLIPSMAISDALKSTIGLNASLAQSNSSAITAMKLIPSMAISDALKSTIGLNASLAQSNSLAIAAMKLIPSMAISDTLKSTIGLNASLAQSNSLAMTAMKLSSSMAISNALKSTMGLSASLAQSNSLIMDAMRSSSSVEISNSLKNTMGLSASLLASNQLKNAVLKSLGNITGIESYAEVLRKKIRLVDFDAIRINDDETISYLDETIDLNQAGEEINEILNQDISLYERIEEFKKKHIIAFLVLCVFIEIFIKQPLYNYGGNLIIEKAKSISEVYLNDSNAKNKNICKKSIKTQVTVELNEKLNDRGVEKKIFNDYRFVSCDILNVRKNDTVKSTIIYQLHMGQVIKIINKNKNWTLIEYVNDENTVYIKGWVNTRYISRFD